MKKKITVLGIHIFHDAGAAIVQNGQVLAAINEGPIVNVKHASGYPLKSIEEVFHIAKIDPSEIDVIALVGIPNLKFPKHFSRYPNISDAVLEWSWITSNPKGLEINYSHLQQVEKLEKIRKILKKLDIPLKQIIFVEHHTAHAASAYYLSPWDIREDVLVFTSDAAGDGLSSTIGIGSNGKINRIENSETNYGNSLGGFYSNVTEYLGMDYGFDPFKTMGLAPYGNPKKTIDEIKRIIQINPQNPLCFQNKFGEIYEIQKNLSRLLHGKRFDDIAAATQSWFETLTTEWIENIVKKTDIRKIACAGGTFLNVKANQSILSLECIDDAFFCPAANDEGLAVGAALRCYFEIASKNGNKPNKTPLTSNYFGTSFTNEQIKQELQNHDLLDKAEFFDDIDSEVGEFIANSDKILGRFNGQMEWGPRGLGNRSIIADPSNPNIVRKINKAIKMRDFWMPFGPSMLASRIDDYLIDGKIAPYMILAFDTTDNRNDLTAAIHPYDLTCRPQTVDSVYNPTYEKVLNSFESKTSRGVILNTSFNLHGSPIVWNPQNALYTFKNSALDAVSLGNYLIKKN
jgi:carbamoyltransferase